MAYSRLGREISLGSTIYRLKPLIKIAGIIRFLLDLDCIGKISTTCQNDG